MTGDDASPQVLKPSKVPPFDLYEPALQTLPLVFCSPHSGRDYEARFLKASRLDPHTLRKSEDCFVDQLFQGVVAQGAPLLAARFPRAFVDANREPYELDPELFQERIPAFANAQSVRVVGGLGTIPRIVADGEDIYPGRLPLAEGLSRIETYYRPFHAMLSGLLEQTRHRFGFAVLIDCHSMPSTATGPASSPRPHFVIGDRFGVSCDACLTRTVRDTLTTAGYEVHLNRPYAGGFITEHYGKPKQGVHAVQIEINRGLYLNEATLQPTEGFATLACALDRLVGALAPQVSAWQTGRLAAE